ncbi:MAG TPA: hypothetical protein VFT82_01235 [Candidatus Paceibacterota bacterium]|nr:hypothetical protein [Candidatus Paceibacterota bacterium]
MNNTPVMLHVISDMRADPSTLDIPGIARDIDEFASLMAKRYGVSVAFHKGDADYEAAKNPLFGHEGPLYAPSRKPADKPDEADRRDPTPAFEYSPTGTDQVEFSTDSPHFLRRGGLAG